MESFVAESSSNFHANQTSRSLTQLMMIFIYQILFIPWANDVERNKDGLFNNKIRVPHSLFE